MKKFIVLVLAVLSMSAVALSQTPDPIMRDWVRMKAYLDANYAHQSGIGALSALEYCQTLAQYAIYMDDWFEAGGYVPNAAITNVAGAPIYGGKFGEYSGRYTWETTIVDGGGDNAEIIGIMSDERNGILRLVPNNAAADGINCQMQGESFRIRTNYSCGFGTRFLIDSTNLITRVGLHKTATGTAVATPGTDYIGFYATNSGANANNVYFQSAKNSAATNILVSANLPVNYFVVCAFSMTGNVLVVRCDGVTKATIPMATSVNIPDDEVLTPTMAIVDSTTGQGTLKMDYIMTVQDR